MELRPWPLPDHTTDAAVDHPALSELGVRPAPYLIGVVFLHPSLTVILAGQEMESRVLAPSSPIHCWARMGKAREIGLGSGVRGEGTGGKVLSARTTEGVKE